MGEQEKELREKSEEQIKLLREKVARAGFESLKQCDEYRKEQNNLAGYEKSLSAYDRAVHAENEKIKDETAATKDQTKPDMKIWEEKAVGIAE